MKTEQDNIRTQMMQGEIPEGEVSNEEIDVIMDSLTVYQKVTAERVKLNDLLTEHARNAYISGTSAEMPFNEKRKAVLIIPGGAYWLQSDAEADPIAHYYMAMGYNAFVLRYSVGRGVDSVWPKPLMEASAAMKYIRDHAERYCIDPDYVFVIGSSAGGHLAASLGTLWDNDEIEALLGMEKGQNRPTGMILCYPVITGGEYAHRGSFNNLLGEKRNDPDAIAALSLENCVSEKTAPTFIWTTAEDTCVPPQNTLFFAKALAEQKIPFELHIYPKGGHGASLNNEIVACRYPAVADWVEDAIRWMKSIKAEK
jgi:acetyl esterase/lipase